MRSEWVPSGSASESRDLRAMAGGSTEQFLSATSTGCPTAGAVAPHPKPRHAVARTHAARHARKGAAEFPVGRVLGDPASTFHPTALTRIIHTTEALSKY